ncbi:hypothetical protein H4R34_004553 [Dimargaris verticillata]|uniref:Uncharacterized protein n=1 Tax=Dimargaris verticillata TaxID=2761393 RepID=A0A9W8AYL7_9FUNG|nr:hypothetical protein H4R34_004553 [Dimargaris verticillata]
MITSCFIPPWRKSSHTPTIHRASSFRGPRGTPGRRYTTPSAFPAASNDHEPGHYRSPYDHEPKMAVGWGPYATVGPSSHTTGSRALLASPPKLLTTTSSEKKHMALLSTEEGYSSSVLSPSQEHLRRAQTTPTKAPQHAQYHPQLLPPPQPLTSPLNLSLPSLHEVGAKETVIPPLHAKVSAWGLADHRIGTDNFIQPPKRSWRSSYEVW